MAIGITTFAMRWAVGTEQFRPPKPLTPPELLEKAASYGAQVVQICENVRLDGLPGKELASLVRRAGGLGLVLEAGMSGSRPEKMSQQIEIARQLHARLLRITVQEPGWDPSFEEAVSAIRGVIPALRSAGVQMAVENHSSWVPSRVADLVRAIADPHVGACLDPINSITRLVGPAEAVSTLAPLALSVHVKGAIAFRKNTGACVAGCLLGKGHVDVKAMLETLRQSNHNPNVLMESWMDPLDDEAATVAQEEAWIRHGIDYLRTHA